MAKADLTALHLPKEQGVYAIVNLATGRSYIGSSVDMSQRACTHRASLRTGIHSNDRLQADWNTFGESSFAFKVVTLVSSKAELRKAEAEHIKQLMPDCYNHSPVGARKDKIDPGIAIARAMLPRRVPSSKTSGDRPMTVNERQKDYRRRMKDAGLKEYRNIWIHPEDADEVKGYVADLLSKRQREAGKEK